VFAPEPYVPYTGRGRSPGASKIRGVGVSVPHLSTNHPNAERVLTCDEEVEQGALDDPTFAHCFPSLYIAGPDIDSWKNG